METLQEYEDDGYEYQYDDVVTETFLVDLDLLSVNLVAKPSNPHKVLKKSAENHKRQVTDDQIEGNEGLSEEDKPRFEPAGKSEKVQRSRGRPKQTMKSLQMLDLDTSNPIVVHDDHLYDCSWIDMIGTNMFFDVSGGTSSTRSASPHRDLALTGTSRIKLVGHRAKLSKADSLKRKHAGVGGGASADGRGLPGFKSGNAQNNIDIKKQADFLGRLMDAKKRRAERDLVTVIPLPTKAQQPNTASANIPRDHVDALNRRVVKGDIDALSELQAINSRVNSSADKPIPVLNDFPTASTGVQSPNSGVADHGEVISGL